MNNEIMRLFNNIKCITNLHGTISIELLEQEFEALAENEKIKTIDELNDVIEDEIQEWINNL